MIMSNRVVLPEPVAPMTPIREPLRSVRLIPSSTQGSSFTYRKLIFSKQMDCSNLMGLGVGSSARNSEPIDWRATHLHQPRTLESLYAAKRSVRLLHYWQEPLSTQSECAKHGQRTCNAAFLFCREVCNGRNKSHPDRLHCKTRTTTLIKRLFPRLAEKEDLHRDIYLHKIPGCRVLVHPEYPLILLVMT